MNRFCGDRTVSVRVARVSATYQSLRFMFGEWTTMTELWRKLGDGGEEGGITGLVIKPPEPPGRSVTP